LSVRSTRAAAALLGMLSLGLPSCGGTTTPSPDPVPAPSPTIVITSAGVSPKTIQIALGSRVLFINNDSRSHNMYSDPHPEHTDCPEINQVAFLSPGERRETGNFVMARSCGFHDHDNPDNESLKGTITIQ
jgi:plastocyanin